MRRTVILAFAVAAFVPAASAQMMIPDSGAGDRVMLFNSFNGSLIDINWITDIGAVGWAFTTPKEAMAVGNEFWVSDQVTDAIHRFDSNRNFLSSITAHPDGGLLDNLRGMGTDGSHVYLTVFPSTASRRGIAVYNTAGVPGSFFPRDDSLFDVEPFQNDLLVSNSDNDNIERWNTAGGLINNFRTGVVFPQQVVVLNDGSVLAVSTIAANGIEGVYHLNSDGSLRRFIDTQVIKDQFGELVPRGANLLGNGSYIITASTGVFTYDPVGNSFVRVLAGVDAQYVTLIPEPATLALLAVGGFAALRRRK